WGCAWRQISSHRLQPGRQVPVMEPESIKRVLVRGPNWVGDAVMSIPALKRLREMFPHAHLTMLAPDSISDLLAGEGLADEFVRADDGVMGFLRQVRLLRRRHFDLAVLLQNAFRAALLARASGARSVAGYPTDGRGLLLSTSVPFPANYKKDHQVLYYLGIANHLQQALGAGSGENARFPTSTFSEALQPKLVATEDERA